MALAFLRYETSDEQSVRMRADIGSSRYYRYVIGPGFTTRDDRDLLSGMHFESELFHVENEPNPFNSQFELRIPIHQFDQENRFIQLHSFATPAGSGAAWSRVREVWPDISSFQFSNSHSNAMIDSPCQALRPARSVAMNVAESRFSSAMFWEQILQIAGQLVPTGANLLSGVVNQQRPGTATPQDLEQIINGILGLLGNVARTNPAPPAATPAQPISPRTTPATVPANGAAPLPASTTQSFRHHRINFHALSRPQSSSRRAAKVRQRRIDTAVHRLSRQQVAPALVGLIGSLGPSVLQALGPIFQQAPQLLETIQDFPIRFLNAINQADLAQEQLTNQRVQNMLAQGNAALLAHLLQGPTGNQLQSPIASASPLVASAPGQPSTTQTYAFRASQKTQVDPRVRLRFAWPDHNSYGPVYSRDSKITLMLSPYTDSTPPQRPIPQTKVKLWIRHGDKVLLEKRFTFQDIKLGQTVPLELLSHEIAALPAHVRLMAVAEFGWRTSSGQIAMAGNRGILDFKVTGNVFLESIGERRHEERALSDPSLYRSFWHRLWEGGSSEHRRWELDASTRYYYSWAPDVIGNGRMETKLALSDQNDPKNSQSKIVWRGLLKSGLELDPKELLKLLPMFEEDDWTADEMKVLASDEFAKRANQQATARVELRGRDDERGSVWVFPIVDLVDIQIGRVTETDETGLVTLTDSYTKSLPLPVSAIFVGAQLEN
ncbi:MAG: hypothetical protein R3C53_00650 [Pirellulaceae bacterium]